MTEYLYSELQSRYAEDICSRCGTIFLTSDGHRCTLRAAIRARRAQHFTNQPLLAAPSARVLAEENREADATEVFG